MSGYKTMTADRHETILARNRPENKPPRMRKCAICRTKFQPRSSFAKACSPPCAQIVAQQARMKAQRRETRARLEAIKPRAKWLKEAEAAFNAYIRFRDRELPCVSCCRYHDGAYDAGHFLSVGAAPELRFNEYNCHRQCVPCNQHKGGNAIRYRQGLIVRIGLERVEWLEGPHAPLKLTIDEIRAIKAKYKRMLKEAEK